MKRRSLIGPLLLVLIGAFFLAENLHPEWVSFRVIATYWPLLLIVWGLLRLAEILYWRLASRPLPARGISGGEWTLIIFICLIGSGLFLFHQRGPRPFPFFIGDRGVEVFGEAYDYPVPEQRQAIKVTRVVIENLRGNTRVVGAEGQEIKVGGRKTVRAYRQSEADDTDKRTPVEIIPQGDQILIRTNQERGPAQIRVSTDLEITVPRGTSIQASGRAGDVDVLNVEGGVEVSSGSAGVRLQDIGGNVRADLRGSNIVRAVNVKGKVEILGRGRDLELDSIAGGVTVNGYFSGNMQCRNLAKPMLFQSGPTELRIEQLPGELHMDLSSLSASNVAGPIRLTARSMDASIQDFRGEVQVTVERGDISLLASSQPSAGIDAITRSGNVELTLPANASFELTGTTHRGEVSNAFGESVRVSTEGAGASLRASIGKGPRITLTTDRGEITLKKQ